MPSDTANFDIVFGRGRGSENASTPVLDFESIFWSKGGFEAPDEVLVELAEKMTAEALVPFLAQAPKQEQGKRLIQAVVAARMTDDIVEQRVREVWSICFADDFDFPTLVERATEAARAEAETALWQHCCEESLKASRLEYIGERSVVGRTSRVIAKYIKSNEDEVALHITGDADWTMSFDYWEQFVRVCTTLTDAKRKKYFRDNADKPSRKTSVFSSL